MSEFKQKIKKIILIFGDITLLYLSLFVILSLRYGDKYSIDIFWQHFYPFSIIYFFWLSVFYINNLYSLEYARNTYGFFSLVIKSFLFNAFISVLFFYLAFNKIGISPKTILAFNILIFAVLFIAWRLFYNYFIKTKTFSINTLLLSDNEEAKEIIGKINSHPQLGYNIIPYLQDDNKNLKKMIANNNIKLIITSEEIKSNPEFLHNLYECLPLKVGFENLPNFYEQITGKIPISIIGRIWFLENIKNLNRPAYNLFKRVVDVALSVIFALPAIILSPLIAAIIKYQDNGPIFYRQKRFGENGKIFTITKFRTMNTNSENSGPKFTEKNDNRITKFGKFLRDTRIDELPQIINVLKGEMSFIGPRPERPEFVEDFQKQIPFYNFRHIVKPGLTGWAQVNYDYGSSIEDAYKKLQYDLYYIKNKSLILDINTAFKTILTIINRKGR